MQAVTAPSLASRAAGARAGTSRATRASSTRTRASSASTPSTTAEMPSHLYDPAARAATYGGNHARYLLDLDANASTTFNFCGGMMFGVSLSPRLREHLEEVAAAGEADPRQPVVYGKEVRRMSMRPEGHDLDARADNARLFHGREVRQAENAAGGGGMLIHLSFAGEPGDDAEGWTREEVDEYSGWLSDRQRRWRDGALLESEGFETFGARFGAKAFTLHHKFYLHVDAGNNFWLSAEDGCEGVATPPAPPPRDFGAGARSPFAIFGK